MKVYMKICMEVYVQSPMIVCMKIDIEVYTKLYFKWEFVVKTVKLTVEARNSHERCAVNFTQKFALNFACKADVYKVTLMFAGHIASKFALQFTLCLQVTLKFAGYIENCYF